MFMWLQKFLIGYIMSICLSARINMAPTGWASVRFDSGDFYENLLKKTVHSVKIRQKLSDSLYEDISMFIVASDIKFT